jgi:tetratricopeptide (TPR) repeat protein
MNRVVIIAAVLLWASPSALLAGQTRPQEDAAEIHPSYDLSHLELSPERRAELQSALMEKTYKDAETILVDEINKDPQSFRAASLLEFAGGIFFLDGQYSNSVIAWKKAEAIAPLDEHSKFTLAMADIKLKRRDWARIELAKLSTSYPSNPLYVYWLARLDYDAQQYKEAITKLEKVTELDPKMTRAYDLLGLCYDYLGLLDEATKYFTRAVQLNRAQAIPSPWPSMDLAISQIELNLLADAEKNLREALSYDSRMSRAQYQLGRVLEKEGRLPEAIEALKISAALDLNYPEPHYLLGQIYHRLGKLKLAESEAQQFQHLQKPSVPAITVGTSHPAN